MSVEGLTSGIEFQIGYMNDNTFVNKVICDSTKPSKKVTITDGYNGKQIGIRIVVVPNSVVDNITIYPMIRLVEDTDDTWQPYSLTNRQITQTINALPDTYATTMEVNTKANNVWKAVGELGAKNLLVYPYSQNNFSDDGASYTSTGVTYTSDGKGGVTINGTATNYSMCELKVRLPNSWYLKAGQYILSNGLADGINTDVNIIARAFSITENNFVVNFTKVGDGSPNSRTFTVTPEQEELFASGEYQLNVRLYLNTNKTANNVKIYPMIRLADDTDDTWQPYVPTSRELAEKLNSISNANGGKSAYDIAVDNGYSGTEQQWLDSLKGIKGDKGTDGKSAYEIAVDNGYTGTMAEWLESLKGEKGDKGDKGDAGSSGSGETVVIDNDSNFIYVAHRGLYTNTIVENTADAFINAAKNGFKFGEIDLRATSDKVIVAGHDATMTFYNNGASVAKKIANTTFSELQGYTLDAAGNYRIETLASILFKLKKYDFAVILDIKDESIIADCFRLVNNYGMGKKAIITTPLDWAIANFDIINSYKNIALRIYPLDYAKCKKIIDTVSNDIYLDGNLDNSVWISTCFPIALALNRPIIPASYNLRGVNNKYVINAINGCMSSQNRTLDEMKSDTNFNFTYSDITTSDDKVSLTNTADISAQNVTTGGGYINFYTTNPEIAETVVNSIGENASATITAKSDGKCQLIVQNATMNKVLEVQVAKNGFFQASDMGTSEIADAANKACLLMFDDDSSIQLTYSQPSRFWRHNLQGFTYDSSVAIPRVPENATKFTASFLNNVEGQYYVKFYDENKTQLSTYSWNKVQDITLTGSEKYFYLGIKYANGTKIDPYNDETQATLFKQLVDAVQFEFTQE